MRADYIKYLESDHWRGLRASAISKWGDRCSNCSVPKVDVHHLRYGNLFDVTAEDLMPLCRRCHDAVHKSPKLRCLLVSSHPSALKRQTVLGFLAGRDEAITQPIRYQSRAEIAEEIRLLEKKKEAERKEEPLYYVKPEPIQPYKNPQARLRDTGGVVLLTRELINKCRTPKGGFTAETIRCLGLSFPLEKGWAKRLVGRVITKQSYLNAQAASCATS